MIGVYRYSALGDIAAALPVIRALTEPVVVTSGLGAQLLADESVEVVELGSKGVGELLKNALILRRRGIKRLIDLQNNDRSRLLRLFFEAFTNKGVSFDQSVTHIFYDIAKKSGEIGELDTDFTPKPKEYIVLNMGSSPKWLSKRLPEHKWREFSEVLHERFGLPFVLTGDRSEREYVEHVAKKLVGRVEIAAGKTSIQELKSLLSGAFLCVSTDSAPMHIAAAQKTPTIGLFGATNWIVSAPFGPWSVALHDKNNPLPTKNRLEIGDYYEGIDIEEGLDRLRDYVVVR
ncbi:MAG: hypothetical protein C6H99_02475 [Epsilonproteobacteria bacterium]|nr:hypothetical protein [Campylobacterota bacterium]NPA64695.1 glycosyltransferase family 9 protein [Campylobacterota bacterium]